MTNWRIGQVILGEYMIEKELGRGGMGCVWLVKSKSTGRQYAVKQALIRDDKHRKAFLTELQTWIDLPEHPNIVPCRFFRTVGDEIVIFADYIEGGSLADWIAKGKLTGLEQILDVAIQFGWGLHAIHERGLVHQDVKPGNVLMTPEGVPMVTDFGLTRARLRAANGDIVSPSMPDAQNSILVSFGGMTPAYASPEQKAGKPLSRMTDIWSWGVSVLDMFVGGISCPYGGHIAADVLNSLINNEPVIEDVIVLPETVALVLERCFKSDFAGRHVDMMQATALLTEAYNAILQRNYPRIAQVSPSLINAASASMHEQGGLTWKDPSEFVLICGNLLQEKGAPSSLSFCQATLPSGMAVDHLRQYKEIVAILEQIPVNKQPSNYNLLLSDIYSNIAQVHKYLGDLPTSLTYYDKAIQQIAEEAPSSNDTIYIRQRVHIISQQGATLEFQGNHSGALAKYEKAIVLLSQIHENDIWIYRALSTSYINMARMLDTMGDTKSVSALYKDAILVFKDAGNKCDTDEIGYCLGILHYKWGLLLCKNDQLEDACNILCAAVEYLENYRADSHVHDVTIELAGSYRALATVLLNAGMLREALEYAESAVACFDSYPDSFTASDVLCEYSKACIDHAYIVSQIGDLETSIQLYLKGIDLLEPLADLKRYDQFKPDLALAHRQIGNDYADAGDYSLALKHYDRANALYMLCIDSLGKYDLRGEWAWLRAVRANSLRKTGRGVEALLEAREAAKLLEAENRRTSNPDLSNVHAWLLQQFDGVLQE